MAAVVHESDDPAVVLERAGQFLANDPVRHNVVLTVLRTGVANPAPGRYWIAEGDHGVLGVVVHAPADVPATLTPMAADDVEAVVDAIADAGIELPGVSGDVATAARFAGAWAHRARTPARPVQGLCIQEMADVAPLVACPGEARQARSDERDLLVEWSGAFAVEAGDVVGDVAAVVERRLGAGQLWVWDHGGPVAMAGLTDPVIGVARIGPVYTAPQERLQGYGSAVVAYLSRTVRARGERCILYSDVANPDSNSVYRALGYRRAADVLVYRFGGGDGS